MLRRSVTVREADVEAALDVLLPALPAGVHERPAGEGLVELAWFGPVRPPDLGELAVAFSSEDAPDDPRARRRAYRGAVVVAGAVAIRAPEDPPGPPGLPEVVLEAGHGEFGTGAHPTTRACLEILLHLEPGGALADLGCGAGTLAIVAARMGYRPVLALDLEPASVEATRRNARRNGVEVEARCADLLAVSPPPAATLLANLPLAVHRRVAARLGAVTRAVVVSGVVEAGAEAALEGYARAGLEEVGRTVSGGWTTALVARP
jgi:ribosomal protein L11 methyltransferase